MQSQKATSAYFTSKQILPCGFTGKSFAALKIILQTYYLGKLNIIKIIFDSFTIKKISVLTIHEIYQNVICYVEAGP